MVEANGCKHHEWVQRKIDEHDEKIGTIVGMRLFLALITVLLVLFGALFGVNLSTNSKVGELCSQIQGLTRDVRYNYEINKEQTQRIEENTKAVNRHIIREKDKNDR